MLSKNYRMKKNSQFDYIFKNGKTLKSNKLLIFYSKSKSNKPKIGVVVSKKIGGSVTRNHTKRVLREIIHQNLINLNTHYNYIFVARPGIEELSFSEISEIVTKLVHQSEIHVETIWIIFN